MFIFSGKAHAVPRRPFVARGDAWNAREAVTGVSERHSLDILTEGSRAPSLGGAAEGLYRAALWRQKLYPLSDGRT